MLTDDDHYARNRTRGMDQYGVQVTFEKMELQGDLRCEDPERKTCVNLAETSLRGVITGYPRLRLTAGSRWTATGDSFVTILEGADAIDAAEGITVTAKTDSLAPGITVLPSGGNLVVVRD